MTSQNIWNQTQHHWDKFLSDVRSARAAVGATYAGAWFRGQKHSWPLLPSLFRYYEDLNLELIDAERTVKIFENKVKKAKGFLDRQDVLEDDDVIRSLRKQLKRKKEKLARLRSRLVKDGHVPGEGRAFVEFRFRAACHHQSSWQTLAEMQHYGVPTRLLDWSESFVHALAFALEDYIDALNSKWAEDRKSEEPPRFLAFHDISSIDPKLCEKKPTLWVLNPYKLAEQSEGENVLWDPTLDPKDDYFRLFIDEASIKENKFSSPIPILSPWQDERVAAQQGVFTCHGLDARSLDEQCGSRTVRSVPLSPEAAMHGVRFLYEIGGLDRFTMFRDKDNLGKKTAKEFLSF